MAIWYKVEKTKQGIKDFLDCNWGFHDFRIERVEYVAGNDMVEIFLRYDTGKEGVRLRFVGLSWVHISVDLDYREDWLYDTTLLLRDDGDLQWLAADDVSETEAENPTFCTWVKSSEMTWAATDGEDIRLKCQQIDLIKCGMIMVRRLKSIFPFRRFK